VANSGIKLTKKPDFARQFRNIQDEITRQLQPVGRSWLAELKKATSGFDTNIEFGFVTKAVNTGKPTVTLSIVVKNDNQQVSEGFDVGDLWQSLDKTGVRPHVIIPKQGTRLSFVTDYQPHTRPIARSGGPGRATGERVFARMVNHPGYPPRKFSEVIGKRLRRQTEQAVDRGIRLGGKKR
jgi:hypothetical protein